MKLSPSLALLALLAAAAAGCSRSDSAAPNAAATTPTASISTAAAGLPAAGTQTPTPEAAVSEFLDAFKAGNDDKAGRMLTPIARKMVAEQHLAVAPRGSDTAKFEINRVERLAEDGARVYTTLTDVGDNGQPQSDEIIWMVRRVEEGWRIAGVAAPVFKGEPPLLLNFEDEGDILKKQQMVHDEIRRRMEQQAQPGTGAPPVGADAASTAAKHDPAPGVPQGATESSAANPSTTAPPSALPPDGQPSSAIAPAAAAQRPAAGDARVVR